MGGGVQETQAMWQPVPKPCSEEMAEGQHAQVRGHRRAQPSAELAWRT